MRRLDPDMATHALRTLAHHDQAQAARAIRIEPFAIVTDHQVQPALVDVAQLQHHLAGARVAQRVGQAFLGDAEAGLFDAVVRARGQRFDLGLQLDAGRAEQHARLPAQRRLQAQRIQLRRPQQGGDVAQLGDGGIGQADDLRQVLAAPLRIVLVLRRIGRKFDRGDRLADVIVQVARDCPALVFLQREQTTGHRLQLAVAGLQRAADLLRFAQVAHDQQLAVAPAIAHVTHR
ncbi:hypothetical protein D3C72_1520010 [compost metagenome]